MTRYIQNPAKEILTQTKALCERLLSIKREIKAFENDLTIFATHIAQIDDSSLYVKKNRLIVRFMNKFISSGLSVDESAVLTAARLGENVTRINAVYDSDKHQKNVRKKEALLFLVKKLKAAKFSAATIAKITGYHEKYIYKLVRIPQSKKE